MPRAMGAAAPPGLRIATVVACLATTVGCSALRLWPCVPPPEFARGGARRFRFLFFCFALGSTGYSAVALWRMHACLCVCVCVCGVLACSHRLQTVGLALHFVLLTTLDSSLDFYLYPHSSTPHIYLSSGCPSLCWFPSRQALAHRMCV